MDMHDQSDAALVARARGGDRHAFAMLLGRHRPVLLALCRRALGDAMLAEDAAQEASLQAFLSLDRLRDAARFGPWLHGISLNICRQMLRGRSSDTWSWEAMVGGMFVREPVDLRPGPADIAESRDLQARVQYAVAALPQGQRAAVMLFYLQGLSYADTALALGIEVGAVRTRLHKARAALHKTLWASWKEDTMAEDVATTWIDIRVADVWRTPQQGDKPRQVLLILEEISGRRRLPIWIGNAEGEQLAASLEKMETPRPMTYTFMARLLEALGARVREVRISKLVEATFYAEVVVAGPVGTQTVDARPSDAINLAVLVNAPIRMAPEVVELSESAGADWMERMRGAFEARLSTEDMPSLEVIDQMEKVIRGEITGGAAEIVAEMRR